MQGRVVLSRTNRQEGVFPRLHQIIAQTVRRTPAPAAPAITAVFMPPPGGPTVGSLSKSTEKQTNKQHKLGHLQMCANLVRQGKHNAGYWRLITVVVE